MHEKLFGIDQAHASFWGYPPHDGMSYSPVLLQRVAHHWAAEVSTLQQLEWWQVVRNARASGQLIDDVASQLGPRA